MDYRTYFPKFIARWNESKEGLEIRAIASIVTLEGMDASTIAIIEGLCTGEKNLKAVVDFLSEEWDEDQVTSLFELFIEKQIIVDINSMNKFKRNNPKKIETIFANQDILNKINLNYQIIYGRADLDIWSCGKDQSLHVAQQKLISEIIEWNMWSSLEKVYYSCLSDLEEDYVHPELILKYSDTQYQDTHFMFKRFEKSKEYGWLKVKNITKNKYVYVLAEHILFPYHHVDLYTRSTSSGSAAHSQKDKVVEHAIFELIQPILRCLHRSFSKNPV